MMTKLTGRELWIVSSAFSDLEIEMDQSFDWGNLDDAMEHLLKEYKREGIQLDVYVKGANPFTERVQDE